MTDLEKLKKKYDAITRKLYQEALDKGVAFVLCSNYNDYLHARKSYQSAVTNDSKTRVQRLRARSSD